MLLGEECPYKTPCGWCYRLNTECKKKRKDIIPKNFKATVMAEEKLLNPADEYAATLTENHGRGYGAANGKSEV